MEDQRYYDMSLEQLQALAKELLHRLDADAQRDLLADHRVACPLSA